MKKLNLFYTTVFTALSTYSSILYAAGEFSNLMLLDNNKRTGNLLFRGSAINDKSTIYYDQLIAKMKEVYPTLPSHFKLIDISLVTNPQEFQYEKSYFQAHPEKGKFLSLPVAGIKSQPINPLLFRLHKNKSNAEKLKDVSSNSESPYYGVKLAKQLEAMMTTKYSYPHIFYIHCSAGCDRTGEVATIYKTLTAYNSGSSSLKEIVNSYLKQDYIACHGRLPSYKKRNAIKWACFYFANQGYTNSSSWKSYWQYYKQCRGVISYTKSRSLLHPR